MDDLQPVADGAGAGRYCLCDSANLFFCFYNTAFWLFACETYFYNLYYLSIVASLARAYLLKTRPAPARPDSPSRRLLPK